MMAEDEKEVKADVEVPEKPGQPAPVPMRKLVILTDGARVDIALSQVSLLELRAIAELLMNHTARELGARAAPAAK